jgi:hypothetical protein
MNKEFLAAILHAARHQSRRSAKRLLKQAGGAGTAAELDAALAAIEARPDRAQICSAAENLAVAEAQAEEAAAAAPNSLPRFLIDDTTDIGEARVFVTHTQKPRFIGEIMPEEEGEIAGVTLSGLSGEEVVCRILWLDPPKFDPNELMPALRAALERHWAIRGS